jgi:predicted lipid-binding transport protein (Tim44 family)
MNTPDFAPKNGDFVAYLEALERQQLRALPTLPPLGLNSITKKMAPSATVQTAEAAATLAATAGAVKAVPIGLLVVGLVLVLAGAAIEGGIFLLAIGVLLLWQAARAMIRNARAAVEGNQTQAAQQVANLLAAHTQRKKPQAK